MSLSKCQKISPESNSRRLLLDVPERIGAEILLYIDVFEVIPMMLVHTRMRHIATISLRLPRPLRMFKIHKRYYDQANNLSYRLRTALLELCPNQTSFEWDGGEWHGGGGGYEQAPSRIMKYRSGLHEDCAPEARKRWPSSPMALPLKLTHKKANRPTVDEAEAKKNNAGMRRRRRLGMDKPAKIRPTPPGEVFQCYQRLRRAQLRPNDFECRLLLESETVVRRLTPTKVYSLDGKYSFPSLTELSVNRSEAFAAEKDVESDVESEPDSESDVDMDDLDVESNQDSDSNSEYDSYDFPEYRGGRNTSAVSQIDFASIVRCAPKLTSLKIDNFRLEKTPPPPRRTPPALTAPALTAPALTTPALTAPMLVFERLESLSMDCLYAVKFDALRRALEACPRTMRTIELKHIHRSDVRSREGALADTLCERFPMLERFVWKDDKDHSHSRNENAVSMHRNRQHSLIFSPESLLKMLRSLPNLKQVPGGGYLSDVAHAVASGGRSAELRNIPLPFEKATVCPCVGDIWGNSISSCLPLLKSLRVIGPGHNSWTNFCGSANSRELTPALFQLSTVTELELRNVSIDVEAASAFVSLSKLRKLKLTDVEWIGSKTEVAAELGKALHGVVESVFIYFASAEVDPKEAFEFLRNVYHERLAYVGLQVYRSCGPCGTGYPTKRYVRKAAEFARSLVFNIDEHLQHDDTGTRAGMLKCLHVDTPTSREVIGKQCWVRKSEEKKWKCIGDITDEETYEQFGKLGPRDW